MQCSIILSDTHTTQTFSHLEQGLDDLPSDYLHFTGELLFKIYHTSDVYRTSAEGTNYYALVYGSTAGS